MTTTINNEHKKLNFSSEREQSQACLNSAEHEKNQAQKVLNVPTKREQSQACLSYAEREGLRPKNNVPNLRFPEFEGEWEKFTFDEIAQYKKGPFGSALKKDLFVPQSEDAIKVYEQQNAIKKDWTLSRYYITKDYFNAHMKQFVAKAGDLIVSCAGTIGEVYELPNDAEEGVFNQALMRVRVNNEVANKEIFITVFSSMIDKFSKIYSNGSAIKNIPPFADLKRTQVYLPCKEEQIVIAQLLRSLDERIATQNKIIDKLQSLIKGIAQHCIRELVKGCGYVRLGDICKITTGKLDANAQVENGQYPFFTCAELPFNIDSYAFDTEALLISGNGANLGYINYYNGKFNAYQRTYVLDHFSVDIQYVKWALKVLLPKRIAIEKSSSNTPYIVLSTLANLKLPIPSKSKQSHISNLMLSFERKLSNQLALNDHYNKQKQYMLRQMFI